MLFAALPDSDSVFTPFAMGQLLGIKCLPQRATAVRQMIIFRISNMLSFSALIPGWSLSANNLLLFIRTGSHDTSVFLKQNNNKLPLFFYELLAFHEQTSSRTS